MKYVEPIKSIILTLLVLLSISLTFMIWNYEPEYAFLEEPEVHQIAIGEVTSLRNVIRPYKVLYKEKNMLYGSVSITALDKTMDILSAMELGNIRIAQENATATAVNNLMEKNNQITLFFNTTVPLDTLNTVLNFKQKDIDNVQFDRIILDMENVKSQQTVGLRFVNTKANVIYRAAATVSDEKAVLEHLESQLKNSFEYEEFPRKDELALYLPKNTTDVIQFTYFIDEISQDLLTDALFTNTSIRQKSVEGNQEKYIDGISQMTFDTSSKTMNYVNGSAESSIVEPTGKLVHDTFNFINDHGGFTADFRLSLIDKAQKSTEYQLFFQGHPVYSTSTLTRIVTTWGDNRLFRYRRPYYKLKTDITTENTIKELTAGEQAMASLQQVSSSNSVDDLVIGYYLIQDENTRLFKLEPSWFAISGNAWTRVTPQVEGGADDGLE